MIGFLLAATLYGAPDLSAWYRSLMQPDNPQASCCGQADGYYADKTAVGPNGELIAIITDTRSDDIRGRVHVPVGTRVTIPSYKVTWRYGNPTGHTIVFLTPSRAVLCYIQNGGV